MNTRRIVVTGMGVVSPGGLGLKKHWETLKNGVSCVKTITRFDTGKLNTKFAAEIQGFNAGDYMFKTDIDKYDRAHHLLVAAVRFAAKDAGYDIGSMDLGRMPFFAGMGIASAFRYEREFFNYFEKGADSINPDLYPYWLPENTLSVLAEEFGFGGEMNIFSTGCTASTDAIGNAYRFIKAGRADIAFAGGTEAPVTEATIMSFNALRAVSTRNEAPEKASRPFDKMRDGFVLGEGAAALILEEYERAKARGASIYGEICGFAMTANAHHMTAPEPAPEQSAQAVYLALKEGNIEGSIPDYICAHGSSTQLNGKSETRTFKKAFGEAVYGIPVSSIKSMIGHTLGSAGAMQAIACLMAIREGLIPPTINYEYPDPECDLDYVPNTARPAKVRLAMVNTTGFSGRNAALFLKGAGA